MRALLLTLLGCADNDPVGDTDSGTTIDPMDTGTPPPSGFTMTLEAVSVRVVQGASARVGVTLSRDDGYDGPVALAVTGLPAGVEAAATTAPAGADAWEIELTASGSASPGGPFAVTVLGSPDDGDLETAEIGLFVAGPPGSPDPSFSFDGTLTYDIDPQESEGLNALAFDARGRLLAAGQRGTSDAEGFLLRFTDDGALDTDFGPQGAGPAFPDGAVAQMVVRAGDAPLVLARRELGYFVAAVTIDGAPETAWGAGGEAVLSVNSNNTYPGLLQPSTGRTLAVTPDAIRELDTGGTENAAFAPSAQTLERNASTTLDLDEHILVGGTGDDVYAIERRDPDGVLDPTFGVDGQLRFGAGVQNCWVRALAPTADGGGLGVAMWFPSSVPENPILFRFDAAGQLDAAFGSGGTVELATGLSVYSEVAEQADGRIVVVGTDFITSRVERFNPDGSRDLSFGTAGVVELAGSGRGLLLDEVAGRIVVGVADPNTEGIDILRLWQ
ncbi:MAG: hypothetical protein AAF594_05590 [Bacteroidota bacterium]